MLNDKPFGRRHITLYSFSMHLCHTRLAIQTPPWKCHFVQLSLVISGADLFPFLFPDLFSPQKH